MLDRHFFSIIRHGWFTACSKQEGGHATIDELLKLAMNDKKALGEISSKGQVRKTISIQSPNTLIDHINAMFIALRSHRGRFDIEFARCLRLCKN